MLQFNSAATELVCNSPVLQFNNAKYNSATIQQRSESTLLGDNIKLWHIFMDPLIESFTVPVPLILLLLLLNLRHDKNVLDNKIVMP